MDRLGPSHEFEASDNPIIGLADLETVAIRQETLELLQHLGLNFTYEQQVYVASDRTDSGRALNAEQIKFNFVPLGDEPRIGGEIECKSDEDGIGDINTLIVDGKSIDDNHKWTYVFDDDSFPPIAKTTVQLRPPKGAVGLVVVQGTRQIRELNGELIVFDTNGLVTTREASKAVLETHRFGLEVCSFALQRVRENQSLIRNQPTN